MSLPIKRAITFKSVAVILLFLSWISQNYIYADLSAQKSKFQYDMAFISNEMCVITPWLILFNLERKKTTPDPEVIWNASQNFVRSVGSVLEVAEQYYRLDIVHSSITSEKIKSIIVDLDKAQRQNKIEDIVALTMLVGVSFPQVDARTRQAMQRHYQELSEKEDFWKKTFIVLYVVGSLLLAVGYLKSLKR
jgi:hypothetical protein